MLQWQQVLSYINLERQKELFNIKFTHISKKQVFKNDVITVFEEKLGLPNNNIVTWTFTGKKEVVAIIAEIDDEIIFVKQYRPAIKKELLEIPAGLVEKGEDIIEAAKREFEEEIGYRANKLEKICTYYNSAGVNAGQYHLFYASDLEKTHQHLDENEFLEIVRIPINEIDIFSFEDSKTIIALSYLSMRNIVKQLVTSQIS